MNNKTKYENDSITISVEKEKQRTYITLDSKFDKSPIKFYLEEDERLAFLKMLQ